MTGVDDSLPDGNQAYSIITDKAVSDDPSYSGVDPADVAVMNRDDETCPFPGTYSAAFGHNGGTVFFRFDDAGGFAAAGTVGELGTSSFKGTYTYDGDRFTITNDPSCNSIAGGYQATFAASCASFGLKLVSDGCAVRVQALDESVFTRMP